MFSHKKVNIIVVTITIFFCVKVVFNFKRKPKSEPCIVWASHDQKQKTKGKSKERKVCYIENLKSLTFTHPIQCGELHANHDFFCLQWKKSFVLSSPLPHSHFFFFLFF